jgi:GTP-binding protein
MPLPQVAIVGRPNVGKSSLFNWLAGRKIAIVDDVAGVTRDRLSTLVQLGEGDDARFVELTDTGGVGIVDRDDLGDEVDRQIMAAMEGADLILFVVDVREGLMPLDEEVAARLRYLDTPVILVINKADTPTFDQQGDVFYKLGRGKPVYVSVHQKRGRVDLLELIAEKLPPSTEGLPADAAMKVAVVGRPNTGKSTFINTLAQAERVIVSEVAGTTRDAVDVRFELDGLPFIAIDTAGVRRKAKIRDDLDFYSIHRAERSIRRADVVLLFIDPTQGVTRLDKQLADYVSKQYKPVIFVVNKWDLMRQEANEPSSEQMSKYVTAVQHQFRTMTYAPIAFITAKTGKNVKALLNLAQSMFKQANKRVTTGALNRVLRDAVAAHAPAMRENRTPKVFFATQVDVAPPTVVIFVNSPSLFDATYQRYLLKVFREKLPFHDIPLKLYLRARTQTDPAQRVGRRAIGDDLEGDDDDFVDGEDGMDAEVNDLLSELED